MSIDLNVQLKEPIEINRFIIATQNALSHLLELPRVDTPLIRVEETEGRVTFPIRSQWINAPLFSLISFDGSHQVEMMVIHYEDVLKQYLPETSYEVCPDTPTFCETVFMQTFTRCKYLHSFN